jgi:hypothetical protein
MDLITKLTPFILKNNMKVAVILTGYLRTFNLTHYSFIDNFLNHYDCDVYCSSWINQENGHPIDENSFSCLKKYLKSFKLNDYNKYHNTNPRIEKLDRANDVFDINPRAKQHGLYWGNRLLDQWYLVKDGYFQINNPEKYDIIFRLRFDSLINSKIIFQINNYINIPNDVGGWSFSDHMAYGSNIVMKKYCNLFDHIPNLYYKQNIDISHAVDMPKYYMEKLSPSIPVNIDSNIKYLILK